MFYVGYCTSWNNLKVHHREQKITPQQKRNITELEKRRKHISLT